MLNNVSFSLLSGCNALDYGASIVTQVQQFYKSIRGKEATPETTPPLPNTPGLTAELRRYQCEAIAWMQEREGVGGAEGEKSNGALHMLWRKLPVQEPMETYFNPHTIRRDTLL